MIERPTRNKAEKIRVEGKTEVSEKSVEALQGFLDAHWETLNNAYEALQRKSGVARLRALPKTLKVHPAEEGKEYPGRGWVGRDTSVVNMTETSLAAPPDLSDLVHVWVHEAVHSTAVHKFERPALWRGLGSRSGLVFSHRGPFDSGMKLNEAVTEVIAVSLLSTLAQRTGAKLSELPVSVASFAETRYMREQRALFSFVERAAAAQGVPEEQVMQALVREYFGGEQTLKEFFASLQAAVGETGDMPEREQTVRRSLLNGDAARGIPVAAWKRDTEQAYFHEKWGMVNRALGLAA